MVKPFRSFSPQVAVSAFVHESAQVIGKVSIGASSSIWCNAVVRGDVNTISIGFGTNIQDNCVLHVEQDRFALTVGDFVTVGHSAVLHGCSVEDDCLIGIGAIVLNGARIGRGSVVAAGAIVAEGVEIPPGSLVMGVPGKVRRSVSEAEQVRFRENAQHYIELARQYEVSSR
jgi:carbonic anhydrase/acetyltransferase-like protein (isoleucine patch superfamily)